MRNKIMALMILLPELLMGQDSINHLSSVKPFNLHQEPAVRKPFGRMLIVPAVLIGYGAASLSVEGLKNVNTYINRKTFLDHPHNPNKIDNILPFIPGVMVYGLNIAGIKGRNNFTDRTAIYVMSNVIMGGSVLVTKNLTHEWRPDRSDNLGFPSGHAAAAFAGAEFLRREYGDVSVWYGVAGYAVAATTGYLRLYNDKHWFGDVVAGAGVGILSTDLAYYIYPSLKRLFVNKKTDGFTIVMPTYQQGNVGISMVHVFR
jgi:membrane-associated phospholipid phosphatase